MELDVSKGRKRYIRPGDVLDVDVVEGDEVEVLWDALSEINITLGDSLPGHSELKLDRVSARVVSYRQIRAMLIYEEPQIGSFASNTVSVFTNDTFLSSYRTNRVPGSRQPIVINGFSGRSQPEDVEAFTIGSPDYVTFDFFRPTKQISISAIKVGNGNEEDGNSDYVGYTNDAEWRGSPRGYWLVSQFKTSVSKYTGFYSVEAACINRVIEDWSEFGTLRNELTGKYINSDLSIVTNPLAAAMAEDYDHGIIYNVKNSGIVRVGPYPATNLSALFGDD